VIGRDISPKGALANDFYRPKIHVLSSVYPCFRTEGFVDAVWGRHPTRLHYGRFLQILNDAASHSICFAGTESCCGGIRRDVFNRSEFAASIYLKTTTNWDYLIKKMPTWKVPLLELSLLFARS